MSIFQEKFIKNSYFYKNIRVKIAYFEIEIIKIPNASFIRKNTLRIRLQRVGTIEICVNENDIFTAETKSTIFKQMFFYEYQA